MSAYSHSGHVYFAVAGPYVKIGYSSQKVGARLDGLLNSKRLTCPADLDRKTPVELLTVIPGCVMRDEHRLHLLFAAHHVIGEWYRFDAALVAQLRDMEYVTYKESLAELRRVRRAMKAERAAAVIGRAA